MLTKTMVSFPGLGIDNFEIDNVAFSLGENLAIYWYGLIITLGIIFAFCYAVFRGKYEGVTFDDLIDIGLWTVILGVIGARLYYVLTTLENYIPEPFDFIQFVKNVFNIRGGGLAIYGGIICGILGIIIATRIKKINTLKIMDMAGPGVMIGQLMGRWGNFFNGEAFGEIVTEGHPLYFLRMGIISRNSIMDFGTLDMVYVHPTFLYESLWNLIGFIIITSLYTKKKFNGQIACMYLSWYGFGRMLIEGLRTDSLYVGQFRISQVVGLVCFVVFGGLLIAGLIYSKRFKGEDYQPNKLDKILMTSMVKPTFFEKKATVASKDNGAELNNKTTDNDEGEKSENGENN